jgi:anti-sigma B factor antagonist
MREHDHPVAWASGIPIISAPHEIDITNASEFGRTLSCWIDAGHLTVVVDMRGTTFCDVAGLRQLIRAHERATAAGRQLRLVITDTMMPRVLAITGTDQLLPISTSLDDALTARPERPLRLTRPG